MGVREGDSVEVKSRRGHAIYPARVTEKIRRGCCFAPFHWNDLFGENLAINAATSEAVDPISRQPELKFCAVRIIKVPQSNAVGLANLDLKQKEYLQGFAAGLLIARPRAHPMRDERNAQANEIALNSQHSDRK